MFGVSQSPDKWEGAFYEVILAPLLGMYHMRRDDRKKVEYLNLMTLAVGGALLLLSPPYLPSISRTHLSKNMLSEII
jgi:hypothetical protein